MVKKILEDRKVKQEEEFEVLYGGKGTIELSWEAFEALDEKDFGDRGFLSPGGAAGFLGVSRARVHQLEAQGVIRAFRIKFPVNKKDYLEGLPLYLRLMIKVPKDECYIYIPEIDLLNYRKRIGGKAGSEYIIPEGKK